MRHGIIITVATLASLFVGTAVGAGAQMPASVEDVARALEMERRADALQGDAARWNEAASLLREAARLRPGADPVALSDLQASAIIYTNARSHVKSMDTLHELVQRATDFGEVNTAAHALMDLAFAAARRGEERAALEYLKRAERLAASSHLTRQEQEQLAARIGAR